ncbi:DNA (cytosine-5-)-methyltransferase [Psychrobacter sp. Pi2-52]|uniref:DNA cytosine methyltransferase n=1 Tax=Psychrobacter sp. Pi2-52 TaxID=2774133 RepID=UPI001919C5BD|nr:DNA (cytosine-5-)-methyltransferase [Psychrobacter sp. Pi2-52]
MKSLEIFSGAGGLAKGLEESGFDNLALVEFNKDACKTLRANFNSRNVHELDIRSFDFTPFKGVDLIAGGPPCQPFSLGGSHKAFNDERDMFPYAIKAIDELKPKAFVFENVKGILRPSFSEYFDYILLRLKYPSSKPQTGLDWSEHLYNLRIFQKNNPIPEYEVSFKLINTANYGIPQTRERVIIVGLRADIENVWKFPKEEFNLDRLLWEQFVSMEYWERHHIDSPLKYSHSPTFLKRAEKIRNKYGLIPPSGKPWRTMRDVLGYLPDPKSKHGIEDHNFRNGARSYPGHTGSMFDLPSKTIKAGAHGVPGGENMIRYADDSIRYLTVHEAKLIQEFPSDFVFSGAWGESMRQIGNAVPVTLGRKIGNQLANILSLEKNKLDFENDLKASINHCKHLV